MTARHPLIESGKVEPQSDSGCCGGYSCDTSIAISLKRIADALDDIAGRNPAKLGLVDSLYNALTEAIGRMR